MIKVVIQIPCYNEAKTLPEVAAGLPRSLAGVDRIDTLVIDDGSSDRTAEVARQLGIHEVIRLGSNRGLATAFLAGIRRALEMGADIIVNTDGDNQYRGEDIEALIRPILEGKADMVVGARPIDQIEHFSWCKKKLQRWGSHIVGQFSGTDIPDTTSGFRAYSAEAAMRLHVFNRYTYTLETIIQAGHNHLRLMHVPIQVNPKTRESRLITSPASYIWRSGAIILRSYVTYKPLRTFFYFSLFPALAGLGLCGRFLYFYVRQGSWPSGHIQSLILTAILLIIAFNLLTLGILSDLISANRKLIEELLYHTRRRMYHEKKPDGPTAPDRPGD